MGCMRTKSIVLYTKHLLPKMELNSFEHNITQNRENTQGCQKPSSLIPSTNGILTEGIQKHNFLSAILNGWMHCLIVYIIYSVLCPISFIHKINMHKYINEVWDIDKMLNL